MIVGVYYPFRIFAGGGEKYLLKLVEILAEKNSVEILSPHDNDYLATAAVLNIRLPASKVKSVRTRTGFVSNVWRDLTTRFHKRYDLFIAISNSVMPDTVGLGRRNFFLLQFPFPTATQIGWVGRLLIKARINTYDLVLCYSEFAKHWINERLNTAYGLRRPIKVLYPYLDAIPSPAAVLKNNVIISVGRFFAGGHNKKHAEMIEAFRLMCDQGLKGWELRLVGSTRPEREHQEYLQHLRERAVGYSISFHLDVSHDELTKLYQTSKIYWHATGLNENLTATPEKMEHFGMTIVEAMAYGCVPIVYAAGGPVEIVTPGNSGIVFKTERELRDTTDQLIRNPKLLSTYADKAKNRSQDFSLATFRSNFQELLRTP